MCSPAPASKEDKIYVYWLLQYVTYHHQMRHKSQIQKLGRSGLDSEIIAFISQ